MNSRISHNMKSIKIEHEKLKKELKENKVLNNLQQKNFLMMKKRKSRKLTLLMNIIIIITMMIMIWRNIVFIKIK